MADDLIQRLRHQADNWRVLHGTMAEADDFFGISLMREAADQLVALQRERDEAVLAAVKEANTMASVHFHSAVQARREAVEANLRAASAESELVRLRAQLRESRAVRGAGARGIAAPGVRTRFYLGSDTMVDHSQTQCWICGKDRLACGHPPSRPPAPDIAAIIAELESGATDLEQIHDQGYGHLERYVQLLRRAAALLRDER